MRAWRAHQHGPYREVLRLEEIDRPRLPEGGAIVRVEAASLNFPDLLAIAGAYQVKSPLPFVPGMEAAGVVVEAGPASRWRPGDRVIANGQGGAFAAEMAADDAHLFAIPPGLDAAQAASFLITYQTGWFALARRAGLRAGETLLVHGGAGGVGVAAIQLGRALGATVIATAGGADKLAVCRRAGAHHAVDYRAGDWVGEVNRLTDGRGADVIYDPVGGDVFDQSLRCLAWEGRLLVIGFASGRIPEPRLNRVLLKNVSIVGLYWGAYQLRDPAAIQAAHEALSAYVARGELAPLVWKELPLAELPEALAALESRASWGKIVVRP
jgi:NADPH:quinone reductase